jgi:hypothetical protein
MDGLPDEAHVGLVRYGTAHLENTFNALEFITAKQLQYSEEREVRAWLTSIDPLAGGNRHSDLSNGCDDCGSSFYAAAVNGLRHRIGSYRSTPGGFQPRAFCILIL